MSGGSSVPALCALQIEHSCDDPVATAADLHNVRSVQMVACPVPAQVPTAVTNAFIGSWTLQLMHSSMTRLRSAAVFAGLALEDDASTPALPAGTAVI